jgi:hypothetical protein
MMEESSIAICLNGGLLLRFQVSKEAATGHNLLLYQFGNSPGKNLLREIELDQEQDTDVTWFLHGLGQPG